VKQEVQIAIKRVLRTDSDYFGCGRTPAFRLQTRARDFDLVEA